MATPSPTQPSTTSGVQTTQIETLAPQPRTPANSMPGGTAHTAGGEKVDAEGGPSYIDAVRSLGPEYYMNFHKRPCVRDSQLQGLAAGFAGGSLAAIIGSTSPHPPTYASTCSIARFR
jgi:cytochrome c oxidase assembly protein subunit 20